MITRRPVVNLQIVRRRADGMVYARLRWKGQERPHTLGWVTPEEAGRERDRAVANLVLGHSPTPSPEDSPLTVADLLTDYGEDVFERQAGGEGHRTNVVNRTAALVTHIGKHQVEKVTVADLNWYIGQRRQQKNAGRRKNRTPKKATVRSEIALLRLAWNWGRVTGKVDAPWPGRPSWQGWPDDARPPRKLSAGEIQKLLDTAREQDEQDLADVIEFMAWCPRRPIAIFGLERAHVARALDEKYDGADLAYFVRDKGGRQTGWAPLLPEARAILVRRLKGTIGPADELVWRTPTAGLPYTATRLGRLLTRLAENAGVADVHVYDLRKSAAVRAYRATKRSLKATARFSGHKDPVTLLRQYLYDEDEAVEMAVRGESEEQVR